jgi:hypothetical protein
MFPRVFARNADRGNEAFLICLFSGKRYFWFGSLVFVVVFALTSFKTVFGILQLEKFGRVLG